MNENAKKWVEALRSGEFRQATGRLRRDGAYCCLGVACELYRRETGEGEWAFTEFRDGTGASASHLTVRVCQWLGLASNDGKYGNRGSSDFLTNQNDGGAPFTEIADIIESEPEGLFA